VKEWVKYGIIFFLGMTSVYFYLSLRQSGAALLMFQAQVQQQMQALNGQCKDSLERQGFVVSKQPPAPPPEEEDNAER
jgi:hypothetical protein